MTTEASFWGDFERTVLGATASGLEAFFDGLSKLKVELAAPGFDLTSAREISAKFSTMADCLDASREGLNNSFARHQAA